MRNHSPSRALAVVLATLCLGLGLGCNSPSNEGPPQKTGEGPNDPNVKTDDHGKKKVVDENPEPNPDGIELKPVGQGGGPSSDEVSTPPPATPPPVKKPVTPKPKPTAKPAPSSSTPPVWTPPPLPSGWTWPFPNPNAPPAGSTTAPPAGTTTAPPAGSTKPDAGPGTGWTLPPFGGS